jgi:hypothetical protein
MTATCIMLKESIHLTANFPSPPQRQKKEVFNSPWLLSLFKLSSMWWSRWLAVSLPSFVRLNVHDQQPSQTFPLCRYSPLRLHWAQGDFCMVVKRTMGALTFSTQL